jgi:large subunit ribosomal protein L18
MLQKGMKEAVLDIGMQKSIKGCRLFAALKGVVDAGVEVPHSDDILPSEDRLTGKHIDAHLKNGITKNFEEVKNKILK